MNGVQDKWLVKIVHRLCHLHKNKSNPIRPKPNLQGSAQPRFTVWLPLLPRRHRVALSHSWLSPTFQHLHRICKGLEDPCVQVLLRVSQGGEEFTQNVTKYVALLLCLPAHKGLGGIRSQLLILWLISGSNRVWQKEGMESTYLPLNNKRIQNAEKARLA